MRGNLIDVVAKKECKGVFSIGDKLQVQSILLEKPRLTHNAICGFYDKDDRLLGITGCNKEMINKPIGEKVMFDSVWNGKQYQVKLEEAKYAEVGSYNYSVIILKDGREVHDSVLGYRSLDYAFDKI